MVELRKRKEPPVTAEVPAKKSAVAKPKAAKPAPTKQANKKSDDASKATQSEVASKSEAPAKAEDKPVALSEKDLSIAFKLDDDSGSSLKQLLEKSDKGIILFTYPKASTPGCTKQACLFRDSFETLTKAGFTVFGLSRDSPKANTNFKSKQNLQYNLICDTEGQLLKALSFAKGPSSAIRGVCVLDKAGKTLAHEAGGPDATLSTAKKAVSGSR